MNDTLPSSPAAFSSATTTTPAVTPLLITLERDRLADVVLGSFAIAPLLGVGWLLLQSGPTRFETLLLLLLSIAIAASVGGYFCWVNFGVVTVDFCGETMQVTKSLAGIPVSRREIAVANIADVFIDEHYRTSRSPRATLWRVTIISNAPAIRVATVRSVREGNQIVNMILDRIELHRQGGGDRREVRRSAVPPDGDGQPSGLPGDSAPQSNGHE